MTGHVAKLNWQYLSTWEAIMKKLLSILVALSVLPGIAQSDPLDKRICHQNFITAIAYCVDGLKSLDPITRAGQQKTCVYISRLHRDFCYAGQIYSACVSACQATYDTTAANCTATYNPDILCAPADTACQQQVLTQQSDCINFATTALNTCVSGCPIPPPAK